MIERIKQFFQQYADFGKSPESAEQKLQIACAALLIEMTQIDDDSREEEQTRMRAKLRELFSITPEQVRSLLEIAAAERDSAVDYYQFTHMLNEQLSREQKIKLIEILWQIAYADGELNRYEEQMVRKIANLLYLPHDVFIMAKNRALADFGG